MLLLQPPDEKSKNGDDDSCFAKLSKLFFDDETGNKICVQIMNVCEYLYVYDIDHNFSLRIIYIPLSYNIL